MRSLGRLRILVAVWLMGCGPQPDSDPSPGPGPGAVPGGYAAAPVADPEVVAAAMFAVTAHAEKSKKTITLTKVVSAQQQVVAGMNYKLVLAVDVDGQPKEVEAAVYKDLKRTMQLTSWVDKE